MGDEMGVMRQYLTSTKNVPAILRAIQQGQAPDRFSIKHLESLDFKSTYDRLIISVLKGLGFLQESGAPTERYVRFLDPDQSRLVMRQAIEEAYSDLFKIRKDAYKMTRQEVRNKFKTLTEGKLGEDVLDKMAATFVALGKEADFESKPLEVVTVVAGDGASATHTLPQGNPAAANGGGPHAEGEVVYAQSKAVAQHFGQLHYNIQIHLPASRDPAVYDALFKSLREHLLK